jgi:hypothetical protein
VPLQIGLGDLANRLRRALSITGRIPTALDETIVPVVIVRDANGPPFALDPSILSGERELAAIVGVQGTIAIANQGPVGSVFMLDDLWISNSVAGGRVEVSKSGVLATDGTFTDQQLADFSTSCKGIATALRSQVLFRAWTVAPAATGGAIGPILRVLTTDQHYPIKGALRAGEVVYVKNLSTNQELHVSCQGRFFSAGLPEQ